MRVGGWVGRHLGLGGEALVGTAVAGRCGLLRAAGKSRKHEEQSLQPRLPA